MKTTSAKGTSVKQLQVTKKATIKRDRDAELRDAHLVAFTRIAQAGSTRRDEVKKAVDELIDACERYITA